MRLTLLFLLISVISLGQEVTLVNKTALDVDTFVGFDSYNHRYYINNNTLFKEGELGSFNYQDFQLGPITSVDIINPLNVVVFYEQLATVIFLDNRLNELERINFNDLPSFLNVGSVTNAGNNRLWLFNLDTQQLELYHYRTQIETVVSQPFDGQILSQSSNFMDCTLLFENNIKKINIYGSLLYEIPSEGFTKLVSNSQLAVGLKENECYWINKTGMEKIALDLPEKAIKQLQLTKDFLYIYNGETLFTYALTKPN